MRFAAAPVGLVLVGVAVALLAGGSTAGVAVAMALIGSAAVVAVATVFFAIGQAEDREREQATPPPAAADPDHPRTLGLGPERRSKRPPRRPQ